MSDSRNITQEAFQLRVCVQPDWESVEQLRKAVVYGLRTIVPDQNVRETIGIIAAELLENAIKYGDWTSSDGQRVSGFVLGVDSKGRVMVRVSNRVHHGSEDANQVLETIRWLREQPSKRDAYLNCLRAAADRERSSRVSRLGLARLAYEAACELWAELDQSNVLHICATAQVPV